jgi:hypothetical protein
VFEGFYISQMVVFLTNNEVILYFFDRLNGLVVGSRSPVVPHQPIVVWR